MLDKYRSGLVPQPGTGAFGEQFADLPPRVHGMIVDLQFRDALEAIWELVAALNRAIDERKPWVLFKEGRQNELDALLYDLCEGLRWLAILLYPFMPQRSSLIWQQLGVPDAIDAPWQRSLVWGGIAPGTQTARGEALFPRIEALAT
jgi:methionyl-tRNA synthetase